MARWYPRLCAPEDACAKCGGTGRVVQERIAPLWLIPIGDNTRACPSCHGTGTSLEGARRRAERLLAEVNERVGAFKPRAVP